MCTVMWTPQRNSVKPIARWWRPVAAFAVRMRALIVHMCLATALACTRQMYQGPELPSAEVATVSARATDAKAALIPEYASFPVFIRLDDRSIRDDNYCPRSGSLVGWFSGRLRRPHTLKMLPGTRTLVMGYLDVKPAGPPAWGVVWRCLHPVVLNFEAQAGRKYEVRAAPGLVLELVNIDDGTVLTTGTSPGMR
jgi:hypothetical protein